MAKQNPFLTTEHITKLMGSFSKKAVKVMSVEPYSIDNSASILVTLTSQSSDQLIGHFGLRVKFKTNGSEVREENMVLKIKPHGREISKMLAGLAELSDPQLGKTYAKYQTETGFYNTHLRELEIYRKLPHPIQPEIYGLMEIPEADCYQILMQDLSGMELLNTVMEPEAWTEKRIKKALKAMAKWHAHARDAHQKVKKDYWKDTSAEDYLSSRKPLWKALVDQAHDKFPRLYPSALHAKLSKGIERLDEYESELNQMPKTLVHNDFNPRNSCFVNGEFLLYDWELATWHVPQYDLVEFLCFIGETEKNLSYVNYYHEQLNQFCDDWANEKTFQRGLALAA
ncbi:MAG TPA: phosphotransferase, partial [Cryomorphaceae bacterium]|nr:phosphotransferase [Cryomorphaceae bacterium]